MGLLFGALTSLAIGGADLFGRRVSNVSGPVVALVAMQFVALLTSLAIVAAVPAEYIAADIAIGLLSGVGLGVGAWAYLIGLEKSTSAVVAPLVATMSAVVPYGYAMFRGAAADPVAVAAAAVALGGLVAVTFGAGRTAEIARGVRWGAGSGLGFGLGLAVIIEADEASGAWPSVGQRVSALAVMLAVAVRLRIDPRPAQGLRVTAVAAGVMAGLSTVFFLIGVQADAPSAVVTASLFPAVTVVVGRFVYGDSVLPRQVAGIAVVIVGVIGVSIA